MNLNKDTPLKSIPIVFMQQTVLYQPTNTHLFIAAACKSRVLAAVEGTNDNTGATWPRGKGNPCRREPEPDWVKIEGWAKEAAWRPR